MMAALPGVSAHAHARKGSSHHNEAWARDHFATAERMREAMNGRPPAERTRKDYQRVLNAYRGVYYGAPASTKADPSAVAVAETLVEMGRRFDDDKILNEAIAQYKFLRREYPGSKYRCDALFTIGEIYKDDLNDAENARSTFEEFLQRYPHNRLVEDAQQAIAELDQQAKADKKADTKKKLAKQTAEKNPDGAKDADASTAKTSENHSADATSTSRVPRVTGIRHWSTPDYTRVAIDLESEVKYGSMRIADPDRIFFDLRGTKLASTLVGKTFDVDDVFLKKIRVAQFQPGRTRVVLEVESLSDYDAFLLPNPYRLIIDIHGKGKSVARSGRGLDIPSANADVEAPTIPAGKAADGPTGNDVRAEAKDAASADDSENDPKRPAVVNATVKKSSVRTAKEKKTTPAQDAMPDDEPLEGNNDAPTKVIVDDNNGTVTQKVAGATSRHSKEKSSHSGNPSTEDASHRNADLDVHEAKPTASGDRSLIRALGLKIGKIVIDAGHGGHDTGTIGPDGLEEKDLVLEVARKLGKLLETRLGAEVVYTRKDDTFIPLETRTAIANQQRADLFISIHANSSRDPSARGVETYYLNFTSSPEALDVAARENAVSEKSIYELQDLVKKIALKEKIEESREFAGDVQESLHSGLAAKNPGIRNRGVKKAPFIVLIGANMPSILAEISFVSNPTDEHRLETSEYREKIAESLYRGIAKYVDGLSGVKLASQVDKPAGQ